MKVKSKEMFIDEIAKDSAWRKHELSVMRKLIDSSSGVAKHSAIRASVVMLYSHWEGHIKKAGKLYINYLNHLGLKYSAMSENNLTVGLFSNFNSENQGRSFYSFGKYVDFITVKHGNDKFNVDSDKVINTKSNLQLEVLSEIFAVIGISDTQFLSNKLYIDEKLLKYRNCIAHGEDTRKNEEIKLDPVSYQELHEKVVELIAVFDTDLCNHVVLEKYKKAVTHT
ncbi:MAE_28990/MAE_18760 family HEPN-like nuclease [Serratia sp. IR-2025]